MTFVGRARPLSRLLTILDEAATGRARVVLVSGEAGIGKTTLISEAARRSGWPVGWGTCVDADRAPALWPWASAIRGLLTGVAADEVTGLVGIDAAPLGRVLPELYAGPVHHDVDAGPVDPDAARMRLFDSISRLVERLSRRGRALVVLDDLQWTDGSTLSLLRFLARALSAYGLTCRSAYEVICR